jgi:pimeloyl-ACP methyl ester carboxylesterase
MSSTIERLVGQFGPPKMSRRQLVLPLTALVGAAAARISAQTSGPAAGAPSPARVPTLASSNTRPMADLTHGTLQANGISIHYVEQGSGPLVVMCHGFPESWYSWRHQLPALAAGGFRAVALDMRGYGGTSKPQAIGSYSVSHLVGDVVGAIAALGEKQAVVIGHDWGGPVAWYSALMRPDVVRAVAVLSVPFNPPTALPDGVTVGQLTMRTANGRDYYRLYFQEPGRAEKELEADVRKTMLGILHTVSGDIVRDGVRTTPFDGYFPKGQTFIQQCVTPAALPSWLSEADLAFYTSELSASGFRGGLNWYRNIDSIPGILAPFVGTTIRNPAFYLYGEYDLIAGNTPAAIAAMKAVLPDLRGIVKLEGAGHWLQQERSDDVNRELLRFLRGL